MIKKINMDNNNKIFFKKFNKLVLNKMLDKILTNKINYNIKDCRSYLDQV